MMLSSSNLAPLRNSSLATVELGDSKYSMALMAGWITAKELPVNISLTIYFVKLVLILILISSRQFVHRPTSQHHVRTVSIKLRKDIINEIHF
jgi:hypothetical protein